MTANRPYVLSIAGFDPSAGAGVLADIKTLENNGVYGMGVVSALTWQNDIAFEKVEWLDMGKIIDQVAILLNRFEIRHIKIGLIENVKVLTEVLDYLHAHIDKPVIIYDPILKATAGFAFSGQEATLGLLSRLYCITPNIPEAECMFGSKALAATLQQYSEQVNIYLKGGHNDTDIATDVLFTGHERYGFSNMRLANGTKHGSGCVLSSALTAHLALGHGLTGAAEGANRYTHQFLASNETLLGYHQPLTYETYK